MIKYKRKKKFKKDAKAIIQRVKELGDDVHTGARKNRAQFPQWARTAKSEALWSRDGDSDPHPHKGISVAEDAYHNSDKAANSPAMQTATPRRDVSE